MPAIICSTVSAALALLTVFFGERFRIVALNWICFPLLFFLTSYFSTFFRIVAALSYWFLVMENVMWIGLQHPLDVQVWEFFDFEMIATTSIITQILYFVLFIPLFSVLFWKLPSKRPQTGKTLFAGAYSCFAILLYMFISYHYETYHMNGIDSDVNISRIPMPERVVKYFEEPFKLENRGNRKNLLIYMVESLETPSFGPNALKCDGVMKYMTNVSKTGYFNPNLYPTRFHDHTAGASMIFSCGMPYIGNTMSDYFFSDKLHCLSHVFQQAGYDLINFHGVSCSHGRLGPGLTSQGWHVECGNGKDFSPMDYEYHQKAKEMMRTTLKNTTKPWVLWINTALTHMYDLHTHPTCKQRIDKKCHKLYQSFDCTDQMMEDLFKTFYEEGLDNNTEVLILGDHITKIWHSLYTNPRHLPVILPFHKDLDIKKDLTMYDLAPTVLDLMGLEVSPKFAYGSSVFSPEKGTYPSTVDEFTYLYSTISHRHEKEPYIKW